MYTSVVHKIYVYLCTSVCASVLDILKSVLHSGVWHLGVCVYICEMSTVMF